jgi:hypothetical protein
MDYKSKVEMALQKLRAEILEQNQQGQGSLMSVTEGLGEITIKTHQLHYQLSKDKPEIDILLTQIAAFYVRIQTETYF